MPERILVADDDPGVVKILAKTLTREGHTVDSAMDGSEALDLATKNDYTLIISDIVMPQMTGITFFELLKKIKPETPIILISGYTDFNYALKALSLGAMAFLVKPFGKGELLIWVDRVVSLQRGLKAQKLLFENPLSESHEVALETGTLTAGYNIQVVANYLADVYSRGRDVDKIRRMKMELAIMEALRNALEHGNLGLSSSLKREMDDPTAEDPYHLLLKDRLKEPGYAGKRIFLKYSRINGSMEVVIRDEGDGFDHRSFVASYQDCELLHGRGLLLIKSGADEVLFNDTGNQITLRWR